MSIKSVFFGLEDKPDLADKIASDIKFLKSLSPHALTSEELLYQVDRLQDEVKAIKREGISMWNYKQAIPKIFDVVDGAFEVMREVIKNQEDKDEVSKN